MKVVKKWNRIQQSPNSSLANNEYDYLIETTSQVLKGNSNLNL